MTQVQNTLTENECFKLVKAADITGASIPISRKQARNRLMMLLMLDAGLRVGEVSLLTRGCLLFADHFCEAITVTAHAAKNNRQRQIPTSQRLMETIKDMSDLVWKRDECPSDGFAFYYADWTKHISVRQIQRVIEGLSQFAIGREINPHLLRHTFATRLMRTVNIRVVQELLGHKSITSTQIYTHPNGDDLKNAIDSLNA